MPLPSSISNLDWGTWLYGLISAGISGGAGAVTGSFGVTMIDPDHFKAGGNKFFEVAAMLFVTTGILNMMAFLHNQSLPAKIVTSTVKVIEQPGTAPQTITTKQETQSVPVKNDGGGQ